MKKLQLLAIIFILFIGVLLIELFLQKTLG
jgi:hypothetical protein